MDEVKKKSFIINFMYAAIIFLIIYIIMKFGLPLLAPFLFAFAIAALLKRPSRFLAAKLRISANWTAVLLVLIFYSTIGIFIALLGFKIFTSFRDLFHALPSFYAIHVESQLQSAFNGIQQMIMGIDPAMMVALDDFFAQVTQSLGQLVSDLSIGAVGMISNYAASLPGFFIRILLMIISTFFIAADYEKLTTFIYRQFSEKVMRLFTQIREYLVGTLFVCIRSYLLIMGITFVELSIGFSIIGLEKPVLIAFFIAIFDILPVMGTGGIMLPWAAISAIQSDYRLAASLLVVYLIVTVIRNVIEPRIVGRQIGLHPLVTLISIFVGVKLFGILGLFGLPIAVSLLRYLDSTGVIKLFK